MAYFECIIGGISDGNTLIVTCDEDFAGLSITCTNGTDTYTETCPSTQPYIVQFEGIVADEWIISGIINGVTYSKTVEINDIFTTILEAGFSWNRWVTYGGLDPTDYSSLADVLADEPAVRRLMTVHASADFLISQVNADITVLDDFTASDNAMKWIGLRDYVCDGLTNIAGVEAELMDSEYWERYLKDHVPVMTSDTAPYGTAFASSYASATYLPYKAFTGSASDMWTTTDNAENNYIGYIFVNPVNAKRIRGGVYSGGTNFKTSLTFTIQGSNDGASWVNIKQFTVLIPSASTWVSFDELIENANYYLRYRVFCADKLRSGNNYTTYMNNLQFYGRSLNVSVPKMTSNSAPFYSLSGIEDASHKLFHAFDGDGTTFWNNGSGNQDGYLIVDFGKSVKIGKVEITPRYINSHAMVKGFTVEASNDGTEWETVLAGTHADSASAESYSISANAYRYWKLKKNGNNYYDSTIQVVTLQFYGVDYSEREFATGASMKYLYDHGLELETFTYNTNNAGCVAQNANERIEASVPAATQRVASALTEIDLTNYSLFRGKVGEQVITSAVMRVMSTLTPSPTDATVALVAYNVGDANLPNNCALDISSFNQSYAVGIVQGNNTGSTASKSTWKELWLE